MGAEWTSGLKFGEVALDRLEIVSGKLSRSSALALPTGSLLMRATTTVPRLDTRSDRT